MVFRCQYGIRDGDLVVEGHPRDASARLVGHQFEVVGFPADDATQRDQGVKLIRLRHALQGAGDFQCARNRDVTNVFFLYLQR